MSVTDAFFSSHAISRKLIQPLLAEIATRKICVANPCEHFSPSHPILSTVSYFHGTIGTDPKGWAVWGEGRRGGVLTTGFPQTLLLLFSPCVYVRMR